MESLKRIIGRINTQLSDLTASQRLAIGLCVVVIVGSFLWLVRWSAEPEFVRLLEEPLTTEQMAAAREVLPEGRYKIVGDVLFVAAEERSELFWKLQGAGALPADTHLTFSKLAEQSSPFLPESEQNFRRRVALQNELAKVIMSSRLVKSAEVFISDSSQRRIGGPHVVPTASIKITMASGRVLDQETVNACAALVSGAVPGLLAHHVSVVDGATLRPWSPPNPDDSFAQGMLLETVRNEERLREKIQAQLGHIPGVRVAVAVELDANREQTRAVEYSKPEVAEEQTSSTESRGGSPSGEPGVGPNVGQALSGGVNLDSDTREETTTRFSDQKVSKEVNTQKAPFTRLRATASVGVPRSYVVGVWRKLKSEDREPTQEEIDAEFTAQSQSLRTAVKNILLTRRDEDVTAYLFHDLDPLVTVGADGVLSAAGGAGPAVAWTALLGEYGPSVGLGLLAVWGMFLLSRLARRAADGAVEFERPAQRPPRRAEMEEEPLTVAAESAGRATPSEGSMLEAREVDDDTMRADQMTEQVAKYVQENPTAVARLVRRLVEASE